MYVDGMNLRKMARHLGVVHQTVANWVTAAANALPAQLPQPEQVETAELDELFTFIAHKKQSIRRHTSRSGDPLYQGVGRDVGTDGRGDAGDDRAESTAQVTQYYSDAFDVYERLVYYPGHHDVAPGKSQTSSVEGENANLRHYLARLARKSRCFSRSIDALRRALKLFVHAWNRRQLHKRLYPAYACHVIDFVGT